jgi:hypothetical protein
MTSRKLKAAIWWVLTMSGVALAAGGPPNPPPGGGGGGNKPPVETTNNLSYPAVGDAVVTANETATVPVGVLGETYSYACAVPETIGTTTFPNTSCVSDDGSVFHDADTCAAAGGKCDGQAVERIYWQKVATNRWAAGTLNGSSFEAAYLDWGDNLESTSWTSSSVIRVETSPFVDTSPDTRVAFHMWHVYGQGTNELWGVHADAGPALPLLYEYDSPYAVINTVGAYLNLSKLEDGARACQPLNEPDFDVSWDPVTYTWTGAAYTLYNALHKPELAVSGKYVYGYNWNLKTAVVPPEVNKAGWWRLTFYTRNSEVIFTETTQLVPPDLGALDPPDPRPQVQTQLRLDGRLAVTEEGDTGPLFTPVIDATNNLTYIDICLSAGKGGGGGKGGGKP